jgi:flagellar hook assembly protein FlgD
VVGVAYKNNILFKVRNITALDFAQISDNRYASSENKSLRLGTEFWFMKDVIGLRGGYSTPFERPGTLHLGLSVRGLSGDLQADMAYLHPIHESAELNNAVDQDSGINFEKFHIGLSYRFGSDPEVPPPTVSAQVNPSAIIPAKGEKATFSLDTTTDVSLDRWSVLIYDEKGKLVRVLTGKGIPPTKVVWAGESDTYEPLAPGTYTWSFQVRDNLGHVGSTAVQTVQLMGVAPEVAKDPRKLYNLRQQQAALLAQESQRLAAQARSELKKLLENPEATPTTANAAAQVEAPMEGEGNTTVPDAGNVAFLTARNLAADQMLNAHFETNEQGERSVMVSYRSNLTYVPYIYQEAADVVKSTVQTVGTAAKSIHTRVYYGKNELDLRTTPEAAANYANGRITRDQLIGLSEARINGETVTPNAP